MEAYTPIVEAESCPQVVPDVYRFWVEIETAEQFNAGMSKAGPRMEHDTKARLLLLLAYRK